MKLTLIKKIENYFLKYCTNPKGLLIFHGHHIWKKILSATVLMEGAKSSYVETNFEVNYKEIVSII